MRNVRYNYEAAPLQSISLSRKISNINTIGNIIKHDLRLQWTNETHFCINISLILFSKGPTVCSLFGRKMKRDIRRERTSSHIFFREQVGVNACTPLQARQRRPDWLCVSGSTRILCFCLNLTVWFSSRDLLPVTHLLYPTALIVLSYLCLLITAWQLLKAQGSLGMNRKSMSYVI